MHPVELWIPFKQTSKRRSNNAKQKTSKFCVDVRSVSFCFLVSSACNLYLVSQDIMQLSTCHVFALNEEKKGGNRHFSVVPLDFFSPMRSKPIAKSSRSIQVETLSFIFTCITPFLFELHSHSWAGCAMAPLRVGK